MKRQEVKSWGKRADKKIKITFFFCSEHLKGLNSTNQQKDKDVL